MDEDDRTPDEIRLDAERYAAMIAMADGVMMTLDREREQLARELLAHDAPDTNLRRFPTDRWRTRS